MEIDWTLAGKIVWFVCTATWLALRWIPNRRSRRVKVNVTTRTPRERFAMAASATGLGMLPLIWVFGGWPAALNHASSIWLVLAGAAIFLLSLRLFRKTHKALGAMWSHSLDLRESHKLVTTGIYEKLRHPMYTAFWLWALAQPFLLANWLAGFSGIVGFGTLYLLRIGQEEQMMEDRFGDEYRRYRQRTHRIIPGIY
jgi:protein-S-isoprenylcysteine O-methyltransferase Ste14